MTITVGVSIIFFHERLLIKSQLSMPVKGTVFKAKPNHDSLMAG